MKIFTSHTNLHPHSHEDQPKHLHKDPGKTLCSGKNFFGFQLEHLFLKKEVPSIRDIEIISKSKIKVLTNWTCGDYFSWHYRSIESN